MNNIFKLSIFALASFSLHSAEVTQRSLAEIIASPAIQAELARGLKPRYEHQLNFLSKLTDGVHAQSAGVVLYSMNREIMLEKCPAFDSLFNYMQQARYSSIKAVATQRFPGLATDSAILRLPWQEYDKIGLVAVRKAAAEILAAING